MALTVVGVALGAALAGARRRPPPVIEPEHLVRPERPAPAAVVPVADEPVADAPVAPTGRRAGGLWGAALVVAFVLAVVAVAVWVGNDAETADTAAVAEQSAPPPEEWDPDVAELAAFVEGERGLDFQKPVPVDFLPSDDYDVEAQRTAVADDPSVALLRAFGLLEDDVDLAEAGSRLRDNGTIGFYDPRRRRIVVRGDDLDVTARATLVHELTHALQDQHFPRLFGEAGTGGQRFGARALVEGDALRMEYAYIDTLEGDEQDEYDTTLIEQADQTGLPETVAALIGAPSSLGDPFVYFLEAIDTDTLADAFVSPPVSQEQVLDPFRYLDADPPDVLDPPAVPAGAEVLARGDFGAAGWLAVLGERIDPWQALDAVDGWRGDAYTLSRSGRGVCADVVLAGDTATDAAELQSAVAAWAAAVPAVGPAVTRVGDTITMTACDPGAGVDLGLTGQGARALILPATRTFTAADEMSRGRSLDQARCYSDDLLRRFTLEEIEAIDAPADFQERVAAADAACDLS